MLKKDEISRKYLRFPSEVFRVVLVWASNGTYSTVLVGIDNICRKLIHTSIYSSCRAAHQQPLPSGIAGLPAQIAAGKREEKERKRKNEWEVGSAIAGSCNLTAVPYELLGLLRNSL